MRNWTNTSNVAVSVDPFFFKIYPRFINICERFPDICSWKYINKFKLRLPPYPCLTCPWPCLQCPPFEIQFEDIYKQVFSDKRPETILSIPYFHFMLEGYDPQNFDIKITTRDGEPITQELNKTKKGFTISFHPSRNNYNPKEGIHGLVVTILPKNEEAAKNGAELNYRLEASDYRFKEHIATKR